MKEGIYFAIGFLFTVLVIPIVKRSSFEAGYLDRPGDNPPTFPSALRGGGWGWGGESHQR